MKKIPYILIINIQDLYFFNYGRYKIKIVCTLISVLLFHYFSGWIICKVGLYFHYFTEFLSGGVKI